MAGSLGLIRGPLSFVFGACTWRFFSDSYVVRTVIMPDAQENDTGPEHTGDFVALKKERSEAPEDKCDVVVSYASDKDVPGDRKGKMWMWTL